MAAKLAFPALIFGMAVTTVVLVTALYGPKENSERAFRLLGFLKKADEPDKPQPPRQARTRTGATTREPTPVA
ncbi:hypothetical protein [Streptomyces nigra]|uniref:hypothetical protein n=1 Tax=Streptomyces nigra TaxID=1827580 RepID=UPI00380809AC